ncbi:IS66 family transposase [bacterium]|nr:IS66 family transposase [bacterium]
MIATLREELAAQREQAGREIARLVAMVEGLTQQLDVLLRDRQEEQRETLAKLRAEARAALESAPPPSEEAEPATPPPSSAGRRDRHGRKPIPPQLDRDTTRTAPQICSKCSGSQLEQEKVLVSEEWDYVRAHLRVRRTERVLCVCTDCFERVVPEQPPMPFDRAACTFSMVAWLCFAKAGLFLPLDRVRRDFKDQGAVIPSSTLTRWWQQGADLLRPVAEAVRLDLLAGSHIRTDGTGLLVVFPRKKGRPKKGAPRAGPTDADGYLMPKVPNHGQILVFGNDEHAVFHYTASKHGHHALDFLTLGVEADGAPILWKGTITADAVSSQDCLFADGDRTEAGCNAHGLRKFRDDADKAPLLASAALSFIGRFYSEEARAQQEGLVGVELLAFRQEHIAPVAAQLRTWIDSHLTELLPSNPVRKAMQYYVNHWAALTRFLEDPEVQLDNNWSERALRSVNLIRNNSLYAGGEGGAVRLSTLLTLIGTSRLLGLNPYEYLLWALDKTVPHSTNRGLVAADITPRAYQAAQQVDAQ